MELRLPRKAQAHSGIESAEWGARDLFDINQAGAVRGFQLTFEHLFRFARRHEEVAIEPLEIAIYALRRDNGFDAINGRRVTIGSHPRALLAVQALDLKVAVIEGVGEVRRRALGHAAADAPIIENDDALAFAG